MVQIARTPTQLGEALRRQRVSAGLSQSQLASMTGLRQATISKLESGSETTRIETIYAVMAALDLEMTVAARSKGTTHDVEDIF